MVFYLSGLSENMFRKHHIVYAEEEMYTIFSYENQTIALILV